jgi:hypothetical protein
MAGNMQRYSDSLKVLLRLYGMHRWIYIYGLFQGPDAGGRSLRRGSGGAAVKNSPLDVMLLSPHPA